MKTKNELLKAITEFTNITDKISEIKSVIKDEKELEEFEKNANKLNRWKEKLSNPKFEVAIVGLEKAGKSTFANALLKDNYLPEAFTRCTYTTTTVEASEDKNYAEITFYTKDEFRASFNSSCKAISLEEYNYDTLTESSFNNWLKNQSEIIKNSGYVKDIKKILELKSEIERFLGQDNKRINDNLKENIKPYITDPKVAMAVKSINIKSTELYKNLSDGSNSDELKNMILYDVPGFDSPTQFHLEQAKQYLLKSDVVIFLISIANQVSFPNNLVNYISDVKGEYGDSLKNKLIFCGTKFDVHAPSNKNEIYKITEKENNLKEEIIGAELYDENNFFLCSSIAYLEKMNILQSKDIHNKLENIGIDNGIEKFVSRMKEFLKEDAIKELNNKVGMDIDKAQVFLREFKNKYNPEESKQKIKEDVLKIKEVFKEEIFDKINSLVHKTKQEIDEKEDFNINEELREVIKTEWIDEVKLSDEKKDKIISSLTTDGTIKTTLFKGRAREITYKKSLDLMKNTITKDLTHKNSEVIDEFENKIIELFNISNSQINEKLLNVIQKITRKNSYDAKSYMPLLDRFLNDIFSVMIYNPITANPGGDRIITFEKYRSNIESFLAFSDNYEDEKELSIYETTLAKKMLVQYEEISLENIKNKLMEYKDYFSENISIDELSKIILNKKISIKSIYKIIEEQKNNLKNMATDVLINQLERTKTVSKNSLTELLNLAEESVSYDEEQEQINTDLDNLNEIISTLILKAAMIEKPFVNSLNNQVEAIRIDVNKHFGSEIKNFIDLNIEEIKKDEYKNLENDPIINEKLEKIKSDIENVIE